MAHAGDHADRWRMIWPVAALAVFLLAFVVVYGSVLQSRIEPGVRGAPDDSGVE
jgi:lipopolysaccharide export LptBFGC system permease protein LptF